MRRVLIAIAANGVFLIPASSQSAQDNVIEHIAEVMAVESLCSELQRNSMLIAVAAQFHGIDASDIAAGGRYHNKLVSLIRKKTASMSDMDEEIICLSGRFLYGEKGVNVKGLLIER